MHIISRKALNKFAAKYSGMKAALDGWYKATSDARWEKFNQVRETFSHADSVGSCVIFDVGGNNIRIVTWIKYVKTQEDGTKTLGRVYIRQVLTHTEYDKDKWKSECE